MNTPHTPESTPSNPAPLEDEGFGWRRAAKPLLDAAGWVRAFAIFNAILGVLCVLTVIGIVIAWLSFWLAWMFWDMANALQEAKRNNDSWAFQRALHRFGQQFVIQAISLAVFAVLAVVGMALR